MKITICSSAAFYKDIFPTKEKLEKLGFDVLIPLTAEKMKKNENFEVSEYKTWYDNPDDFNKKTFLMKSHLSEIEKGDVILVLNLKKNNISGYVGGNVLLEMFYGWINKKVIFLLNPVEKELPLYEEVMGMTPIILNGDLSQIRRIKKSPKI